MATDVRMLGVSQFLELMGLDGRVLRGVRYRQGQVIVMLEPADGVQTSGVYPALNTGGKKINPKPKRGK